MQFLLLHHVNFQVSYSKVLHYLITSHTGKTSKCQVILTLCWLVSTNRSPKQCRSMRFNCRQTWSNSTWPFVSFCNNRHAN